MCVCTFRGTQTFLSFRATPYDNVTESEDVSPLCNGWTLLPKDLSIPDVEDVPLQNRPPYT